jgi:hypothetical protein
VSEEPEVVNLIDEVKALLDSAPKIDEHIFEEEKRYRTQVARTLASELVRVESQLERLKASSADGVITPKGKELVEVAESWIASAKKIGGAAFQKILEMAVLAEYMSVTPDTKTAPIILSKLISKSLWRLATGEDLEKVRVASVERRPWPAGFFYYGSSAYQNDQSVCDIYPDLMMITSSYFGELAKTERRRAMDAILTRGNRDLRLLCSSPIAIGAYAVFVPSKENPDGPKTSEGAMLVQVDCHFDGSTKIIMLKEVAGRCAPLQRWVGKFFDANLLNSTDEVSPQESPFYSYPEFVKCMRETIREACEFQKKIEETGQEGAEESNDEEDEEPSSSGAWEH